MLFGASIFATEYTMHPADLARALEERGFESLWVPEHTHIPASRRSPWPGGKALRSVVRRPFYIRHCFLSETGGK
ncbi:MAG: hypothetical protein C4291_07595 [Candidatus Dadabacteria bacterium]